MDLAFRKEDTDACKGIAICMVLALHLFGEHPELGPTLFGMPVLPAVVRTGSACVAMFVILSGYGLSESSRRRQERLGPFYRRRLTSIYLAYWFIWVVFVPPGVLFFGRGLAVYGADAPAKLVLNLLGVHYFFGLDGYNVTWWFVSLILGLYLLFPFIQAAVDRHPVFTLAGAAALSLAEIRVVRPHLQVWFFVPYILPFTLGVFLSRTQGLAAGRGLLHERPRGKALLYALLFAAVILQKNFGYGIRGNRMDTPLALLVILAVFEYLPRLPWLRAGFIVLGTHSLNIFLFHTFLYKYYVPDLVYWFRSAALIFTVMTGACLLISVGLETLKGWVGLRPSST